LEYRLCSLTIEKETREIRLKVKASYDYRF